jgi:hypothetical protein
MSGIVRHAHSPGRPPNHRADLEHNSIEFNLPLHTMTLPSSVRTLIAGSIHSMAALELLLLLHRSSNTYWTVSAAASTLGVPAEGLAAALQSLRRHGLIVQAREAVAFRYAPRSVAIHETVEALVSAHEQQRLAILEAVHASGNASIEAFADAFRIRRD